MKISKTIMMLPAALLLALSLPASAQTDLTCDDITFGPELKAKYASIADGCWDVVELNGERFAKMKVEILNTSGNNGTFRFRQQDGNYGPTESVTVDKDWRADIGGRTYRMRDLTAGQELNIYIPGDRWEAHVARDMSGTITVYYAVAMTEPRESGSGAALPTTASPLPLIGLLGAGSLFAAFLMRVRRRRQL